MASGWLLYLAAATGCQAVFGLFYWLVLTGLSTFGWNRAYLLSALVASLLLPLLALPAAWASLLWPTEAIGVLPLPTWQFAPTATTVAATSSSAGVFSWLTLGLAGYWLGVGWQVGRTARSVGWLYCLSRRHPRVALGQGWLVQLPEPSRPAFSFGKYVFLSPAHAQLSPAEYALLVQHEQVHGTQYHSLDLLLAEVIAWFFWFNGLVRYLRRELRTVHEYLADATVAHAAGSRVAYGRLLLKLASGPLPTSLVHPFSTKQVAQRIHMLTFPPSSPMQKPRFLLVVPVATLAWVGAAVLRPAPSVAASLASARPVAKAQGHIGTITWRGNKFLTTAQLNEALGLKAGDPYSKEALATTLAYRPDNSDLTSRYMDNGYLFFEITPAATTRPDGTTDLVLTVSEGPVAHINSLVVKGNQKVPSAAIMPLITLHAGELFSRAKLIASQRALAKSGLFDPLKIGINPQPDMGKGLVNIEFVVVEK